MKTLLKNAKQSSAEAMTKNLVLIKRGEQLQTQIEEQAFKVARAKEQSDLVNNKEE